MNDARATEPAIFICVGCGQLLPTPIDTSQMRSLKRCGPAQVRLVPVSSIVPGPKSMQTYPRPVTW